MWRGARFWVHCGDCHPWPLNPLAPAVHPHYKGRPCHCLSRDEMWALSISPEHINPPPHPPFSSVRVPHALGPFKPPLPCEANSFCPPPRPVSKAHWPGQGTRGTHRALAPAGQRACSPITPTPRPTSSDSLLIPNDIRLWENKWERLLWRALWTYL